MANHVLYISYDGMTDPLGQSQVIPYLQGLSSAGYNITILSFEKRARFATHRKHIASLLAASDIAWEPRSYTSKPPVLSTLWDVYTMWRSARQIIRDKDVVLVHCRSYISALVGLELKKRLGIKFIFDMRGFWADERIEGGIWNINNRVFKTIYNFFKRRELDFINQSDYTVSLTQAGADEIRSWPAVHASARIKVIPCCADMQHFDFAKVNPQRAESFRIELDIPQDKCVVTYLGSIGTWYLLDEMLDFFKILQSRRPEALLLFITTDDAGVVYGETAARGIDPSLVRVRKANRDELPDLLSLSSASLFFIKQSFSKTASSPTKMGELMGMGIPLICNSGVGDVAKIMSDTRAGAVVDSFTGEAYNAIVERFDQLLSLPKKSIREGALRWYSLEEGTARYRDLYREVLGEQV